MSKVINTYKINAEITVQAESETQARQLIADLLNSPKSVSPQTGGFKTNEEARIAGINNIEVETTQESTALKEKEKQEKNDTQLANEEIKRMEKEGQLNSEFGDVPDEVMITDPKTGTKRLVRNPRKAEMEEEKKKKQQQQSQQQGEQKNKSENNTEEEQIKENQPQEKHHQQQQQKLREQQQKEEREVTTRLDKKRD